MPKLDDSRPFSTSNMEQPVFSPELRSERLEKIQSAANLMMNQVQDVVNASGSMSIDYLWGCIQQYGAVQRYLEIAGETLGRPFVKVAFSMAIRNYINSKE